MAVIEREGNLRFELEELLHEVREAGYAEVHLLKLYRLLGKGNRAAGTWKKLLQEWQALGYKNDELYIRELPGDRLILIWRNPAPVKDWTK